MFNALKKKLSFASIIALFTQIIFGVLLFTQTASAAVIDMNLGSPLGTTASYQTTGPQVLTAGDTHNWYFTVSSGSTYRFSFCEGGGEFPNTDFDTIMNAYDSAQVNPFDDPNYATNDDFCSTQSQLDYVSSINGTLKVEVTGYLGAGGNYNLAYKEVVTGLTPLTSFQTDAGFIASQGGTNDHLFEVVSGTAYEFTFCDGSATVDPGLFPSITVSGGGEISSDCNSGLSRATYLAPLTGTITVTVTATTGSGNYNIAYREITANTPTTSYQTATSDTLETQGQTAQTFFNLTAGATYRFTFCDGGASAAFDPSLFIDGSESTQACGGSLTEATYIAPYTGVFAVQTTALIGTGSFTMAYRQEITQLPAPTTTFQTTGFQSLVGTQDEYLISLTSGTEYVFTLCTPDGSANFDTILELRQTNDTYIIDNDDFCSTQSQITYTSPSTEDIKVVVRGFGGATGDYELAYKENVATLTPTTSFQTDAGTISTPGGNNTHLVDVQAGLPYEFTLCEGGASVDPGLTATLSIDGSEFISNCGGGQQRISYLAPSTTTATVTVTSLVGTGNYTLAYKEEAFSTPNSSLQSLTNTVDTTGETRRTYFNLTSGTPYKFTFCEGAGASDFTPSLFIDGTEATQACGGSLTEATYTPLVTGTFTVDVTATSGSGNFTLVHKIDLPSLTPTATVQTQAGTIGPGGTDSFLVNLDSSKTYLFSFCQAGGSANFQTNVDVNFVTNTRTCGNQSEVVMSPFSSGDVTLTIGELDGVGGTYTLAYQEVPQLTPTSTFNTVSGQIQADGQGFHQLSLENGKDYVVTLCTPDGSATFDTQLQVGFTNGDDECGLQSEVSFTQFSDSVENVLVDTKTGAAGTYSLAYRWNETALTPQASYQTTAVTFGSGTPDHFPLNVIAGKQYDLTTCSFAGGSQTTDVDITVEGNTDQTVGCAFLVYTATSTGEVSVKVESEFGVGGSAVIAYRDHATSLNAPTTSFQTQAGTLTAGGSENFSMNVTAGTEYTISLCSADGGAAAFDSLITLDEGQLGAAGAQVNNACDGTANQIIYTPADTGDVIIIVSEDVGSVGGNFTLAYKENATGGGGSLPIPTTSYQSYTANLTGGTTDQLSVDVVSGETYLFTFCGDQGSAAFDTFLSVDNATVTNDNTCGTLSHVEYTAPSTATIIIEVSAIGGGSGNYTLQYVIRNGVANNNTTIYVNNEFGTDTPGCGTDTTSGACETISYGVNEGLTDATIQTIHIVSGNLYALSNDFNINYDNVTFGENAQLQFIGDINILASAGLELAVNAGASLQINDDKGININNGNNFTVSGNRFNPVTIAPLFGNPWGAIYLPNSGNVNIDFLTLSNGGSFTCDSDLGMSAAICIDENISGGTVTITNSEFNTNTAGASIGIRGETSPGSVVIGNSSGGNYFNLNGTIGIHASMTAALQIQNGSIVNNFFNTSDFVDAIQIEQNGIIDGTTTQAYDIVNNLFLLGNSARGIDTGNAVDSSLSVQFAYNTFVGKTSDTATGINADFDNGPMSSNIFFDLSEGIVVNATPRDTVITNNHFQTVTTPDGAGLTGLLPLSNDTSATISFVDGPNSIPFFTEANVADDYYLDQALSTAIDGADAGVPLTNYVTQGTTSPTHVFDSAPFDAGFHYNESAYFFLNTPSGFVSSVGSAQTGDDVTNLVLDISGNPRLSIVGDFFTNEGDIDLSVATIESDSGRTAVEISSVGGIEGTHTILFPNINSKAGAYFCPNANELSEVSPLCTGVVNLSIGETDPGTGVTLALVDTDGVTPVASGGYYALQGVTGSGGGNDGDSATQQSVPLTMELQQGVLQFIAIPTSFSFTPIGVQAYIQDQFNNPTGTTDSDDSIVVQDLRHEGGFQLQLQATDFILQGTQENEEIDSSNLYVVTVGSSGAGTEIGGVLHTSTSGPTVSAEYDAGVSSLIDAATYTGGGGSDLSTSALLIDASLTGTTGRIGQYSLDTSYFLQVPANTVAGTYISTFVYTIIPSTF